MDLYTITKDNWRDVLTANGFEDIGLLRGAMMAVNEKDKKAIMYKTYDNGNLHYVEQGISPTETMVWDIDGNVTQHYQSYCRSDDTVNLM
jgi:hypothetical protein